MEEACEAVEVTAEFILRSAALTFSVARILTRRSVAGISLHV